jgi:hypothetical protein
MRRRQHISTIDTNSPSRVLLSTNNNSASHNLHHSGSVGMSLHQNHNPLGYCTLRNGSIQPQSSISTTAISMVSF